MTLAETLHEIRLRNVTVVKNGKAPKHKYATMADVMGALTPVLKEFGVSVHFQSMAPTDGVLAGPDETLLQMVVSNGKESLTHTFPCKIPEPILNSQGASVINLPMRAAGGKTHARRTELILYFNLFTGEDAECEAFAEISGEFDTDHQTGMRGAVTVSDQTRWQSLYRDGLWKHIIGPDGVGQLGAFEQTYRGSGMIGLLDRFPDHPGLIAWLAAFCAERMPKVHATWADVQAAIETDCPNLESCSVEQLRAAAKFLKEIPTTKTK